MNISKQDIDSLNAVIKVEVNEADYQQKVENALKEMRKKANVPGFRKGMVPEGMIRKQYGKSVLVDEINKLIGEKLDAYIKEQKFSLFGQPLPKMQDIDWDGKDFTFEFEIAMTPEFEVDLKAAGKVAAYKIKVSDEYINDHVMSVAKRYGKFEAQGEVTPQSEVVADVTECNKDGHAVEGGISTRGFIEVKDINKADALVGKKEGESVVIKAADVTDKAKLSRLIGRSLEEAEKFKGSLKLTLEKISKVEAAELNVELFDKVYAPGVVATEEEFKNKVRDEAAAAFASEADIQTMNDTIEFLIENTKIDLPSQFLKKWIKANAEKEMTDQQVDEEYNRSEKALRYQMIEAKVLKANDVNIDYVNIIEKAKELIKNQMLQYGRGDVEEKELMDIVQRVLSNQEEVQKLHGAVVREKIMEIFKNNVPYKQKEVTLDEFVKAISK